MAELVLEAEAKLGGMLAAIQPKPKPDGSGKGTFGGRAKTLPPAITKKESHYTQVVARNQDVVAEVKARARDRGTILST